MSGTVAHPEGITNPPIDDLLAAADGSKYALVIYAAKRARQINAYYSLLSEGQLENVGPLVETHVQEKPLSVALREIDASLLTSSPYDPSAQVDAAIDAESFVGEGAFESGFDVSAGFDPEAGFDTTSFGTGAFDAPESGTGATSTPS